MEQRGKNSMINTVIIGAGYMGKVHLETLMRISGIQVKALADTNTENLKRIADKYRIAHITDDYKELPDNEEIEVFHNCTPNLMQFVINSAVIQANRHVLSEKPLAMDASQAKTFLDLALEQDVVSGVNFCYRYYPTPFKKLLYKVTWRGSGLSFKRYYGLKSIF